MKHTHLHTLILLLLLLHGGAARADMFAFRIEPSTEDAYLPFTSVAPLSASSEREAQDTYSRRLMQTGSALSNKRLMADAFASAALSTVAACPEEIVPRALGSVGFAGLSAAPMLMADGTVYSPSAAAAPTMPQRSPGTPGGIIDEPPLPVGDPLLPLLLLAAAYAIYAAYACHKRRESKNEV